jgi:hypothetical protein
VVSPEVTAGAARTAPDGVSLTFVQGCVARGTWRNLKSVTRSTQTPLALATVLRVRWHTAALSGYADLLSRRPLWRVRVRM